MPAYLPAFLFSVGSGALGTFLERSVADGFVAKEVGYRAVFLENAALASSA